MSHYAVAVFSYKNNFDELLKPYNENDRNYFEFIPVDYDKIKNDFAEFSKINPKWTFKQYISEFGYFQRDGQWGYEENPHGYWDWYSLDGKDYLFDKKAGVEIKQLYRKSDIDWFEPDKEAANEAAEFWDEFIDGDNEDIPSFWNREYYLDRYKTKEQYIKENRYVIPYAFITPDGVWHAPGRVGWFAYSNETADDANRYAQEWEEWINSVDDPYVNLVDCHI